MNDSCRCIKLYGYIFQDCNILIPFILLPFPDLGETMSSHADFLPLNNLPTDHEWTGPDWLHTLISDMLKHDPEQRPTAADVLTIMEKECGFAGFLLYL